MAKRLEQLQYMLEASPNEPFLIFAIAKEFEKLEDFEAALQHYTQLTTDHPDYVGTYYHLGKLYEILGKAELAIETYEKGMEVAHKVNDKHAHGELSTAKWELE